MDSTCSQSRVRSPFTPSNCNHTTASCKRKTVKQVESLAGELIASLKAIHSQNPDSVHVPKTQSSAPASECRKIDNNSPTAGSDNTKDSTTNNAKDFHCPFTRKREQNRAWNLIYENCKQGTFRTSPTHHIEQLRTPATCEPRGGISLSPAAKKSFDTHWEAKSKSAKEEIMEKREEMGTSWQAWADENLRREGWSTEQERIELARDLAVIDISDGELDSDDSDDENDFPHIYADIPFPSQTPTDDDDDDDISHISPSTTKVPGNMSPARGTGIATNTSKALLDLLKGPLTPPDTPILKFSEPESSDIFEPSKFDVKRELTLITALINDLGQRLITYQELTDNVFVAALYNADPAPELLSLKSFCAWTLHTISDRMKDTLPAPTQTVPDLRLINSDGEVYSLEERMEILDEFEDRDFARHLAQRDEWQEDKERWFLRKCTAAENEERLQHLERWYEEGLAM